MVRCGRMILSQSRATGWWTELRVDPENGKSFLLTRYQPRAGTLLIGKLGYVHDPKQCEGRGCAIHNHPSDHPLKDAPLNWRTDAGKLERICEHGVGHDDKDAVEYQQSVSDSKYIGIHGCDGCCTLGGAVLMVTYKTPSAAVTQCDHENLCCREHSTHTNPHKGCILR